MKNDLLNLNEIIKKEKKTYEKDEFTKKQNDLYKLALYGLTYYNQNQNLFPNFTEEKIKWMYKETQKAINKLKQKKCNKICNEIYKCFFKSNKLAIFFLTTTHINIDLSYFNTLSLKELKIEKKMIIDQLIYEEI